MRDYEELYNEYRSKYNNACDEVNECNRQISSLKDQRKTKVSRINELNASNRKLRDAIGDMKAVLGREDNVTEKLTKGSTKMETAADNFSSMVDASDVNSKSLTDVFSDESSNTKTAISTIFSTVKTRKKDLEGRLDEQEKELKRVKDDLSDIDAAIRRENGEISEWKSKKTNYYINMEYYKRKMEQEAY